MTVIKIRTQHLLTTVCRGFTPLSKLTEAETPEEHNIKTISNYWVYILQVDQKCYGVIYKLVVTHNII